MLISFFEEYPVKDTLVLLKGLGWKPRLFIAARDYEEFLRIAGTIPKNRALETVYWPVFKREEGYWVSPFTRRKALMRLSREGTGIASHAPLMIDAELPASQNPWLFFSEASLFFSNRRLIRNLICKRKGLTYTCEYYPEGALWDKVLGAMGLSFSPASYHISVIKMMYHSMHRFDEAFIREEIQKGVHAFGDRFLIGLGTIAKGVRGDEPRLSVRQLKYDLMIAKEEGVSEVVIYRLGGLDKRYVRLLQSFS